MTKPRPRHAGQVGEIVHPVHLSDAFWRRWDEVFGETSAVERDQIGEALSILRRIHEDAPLGSQGVRFELETMSALDCATEEGQSALIDWYSRRCHDSTRAEIDRARHSSGSLSNGDIVQLQGAVRSALSELVRGDRGQPPKRRELVASYVRELARKRGLSAAVHHGNEASEPSPMVKLFQLCIEATEGRRVGPGAAYRALRAAP